MICQSGADATRKLRDLHERVRRRALFYRRKPHHRAVDCQNPMSIRVYFEAPSHPPSHRHRATTAHPTTPYFNDSKPHSQRQMRAISHDEIIPPRHCPSMAHHSPPRRSKARLTLKPHRKPACGCHAQDRGDAIANRFPRLARMKFQIVQTKEYSMHAMKRRAKNDEKCRRRAPPRMENV